MTAEAGTTLSEFEKKTHVYPRSLFYKKPIKKYNSRLEIDCDDSPQEVRRQRLLFEQKKNRDAAFNVGRGIVEEILLSQEENEEEMEVQERKKRYIRKKHKDFTNRLMMSEWMLEVPEDFVEKWIIVPCPIGRRTLVIACKGITEAYSKRGFRLGKFSSALPGGNSEEHKSSCTVLDCIWMTELKTYFVLDVLAWSNQPLLNCEADFRLFWLKSQLDERTELKERATRVNSYPILPLPYATCDTDLSEFLCTLPPLPPLDGLLFYHREGQYTHGRTPLVTWLKPFMLSEVLDISIPLSCYEKPDGYIDFKQYISSSAMKKRKTKCQNNSMEVAEVDAEPLNDVV